MKKKHRSDKSILIYYSSSSSSSSSPLVAVQVQCNDLEQTFILSHFFRYTIFSSKMRVLGLLPVAVAGLLFHSSPVAGFAPKIDAVQRTTSLRWKHDAVSSSSSSLQASLVLSPSILSVGSVAASSSSASSSDVSINKEQLSREQERDALIHKQGGLFTVRTKYGALNPYAVYYGTVSILLGLPWFVALTAYQLFAVLTRNKFDKNRKIPVYMNQVWGTLLLRLTRSYPTMENRQVLVDFYKQKRPAMFVANHCSWMDIPFMGVVIGWRNYKMIAKKELRKVPILGKAIQVGGHVMVDRTSRQSQLKTLKDGIAHLKAGVHLCTFPEGTRSKTGRLQPFKNGAFKMAQKAGAPVIPLSICNAHRVNPPYWMFPFIASHGIAKVVVHAPIESVGKTEDELAEAVRVAMIAGLPDDQKPILLKSDGEKKKTQPTTTTTEAVGAAAETIKMEASSVTTSATGTAEAAADADIPAVEEIIKLEAASVSTTATVVHANGDSSISSSKKDDDDDDDDDLLQQALSTIHNMEQPELLVKEEKTA